MVDASQSFLSLLQGPASTIRRLDDYTIEAHALGTGSTATVYLARRSQTSVGNENGPGELALKVMMDHTKLAAEVLILAELQEHPNIVGFYGVCLMNESDETLEDSEESDQTSQRWAIQMECCGESLIANVNRERYSEYNAHVMITDIFTGLAHIHKRGFVHRDVKPDNVLLSRDGNPKITDFGFSARLSDAVAMSRRCGTPGYAAPEVLLGHKYGVEVDTFGAGALLHFIISGRPAFPGSNAKTVARKTLQDPVDFRKSVCLERLSDACKGLMLTLLIKNPDERPPASEVVYMLMGGVAGQEDDNDEPEPETCGYMYKILEENGPDSPQRTPRVPDNHSSWGPNSPRDKASHSGWEPDSPRVKARMLIPGWGPESPPGKACQADRETPDLGNAARLSPEALVQGVAENSCNLPCKEKGVICQGLLLSIAKDSCDMPFKDYDDWSSSPSKQTSNGSSADRDTNPVSETSEESGRFTPVAKIGSEDFATMCEHMPKPPVLQMPSKRSPVHQRYIQTTESEDSESAAKQPEAVCHSETGTTTYTDSPQGRASWHSEGSSNAESELGEFDVLCELQAPKGPKPIGRPKVLRAVSLAVRSRYLASRASSKP